VKEPWNQRSKWMRRVFLERCQGAREFVKGLDRKQRFDMEQEWTGNYGQVCRHGQRSAGGTFHEAAAGLRTQQEARRFPRLGLRNRFFCVGVSG